MQPRLPNEAPDRVVLLPTDPAFYARESSSKEPQYTTSISPVSAKIFTSSYDAEKVGPSSFFINPTQNLGTGFRRVRLVSTDIIWACDNINSLNGEISVVFPAYNGDDEDDEVFKLVNGNYTTIDSIIDMMNSGGVFDAGAVYGMKATENPSGGRIDFTAERPFYIRKECGFAKYGGPMFGITQDEFISPPITIAGELVFILTFGPITYHYTQWVDVISSEITKNQKMRTFSTNNVSNILCRIPITVSEFGARIRYLPETYLACARASTDPLYQFDITFLDQFGKQLQILDFSLFSWNLTLELEL